MQYTYTIIDSDVSSNLRLQGHLDEYGDFLYLGQARNSADGLNSILKHLPDIVFIHLNDRSLEYFQMINELYQYLKDIPVLIGKKFLKVAYVHIGPSFQYILDSEFDKNRNFT